MSYQAPPERIFRYRGYTSATLRNRTERTRLIAEIKAAINGQCWFSSLASQNDPFDTNPTLMDEDPKMTTAVVEAFRSEHGPYYSISGLDLREIAKSKGIDLETVVEAFWNIPKFIDHIPQMLETSRKEQPICCFTTSSTNALMWSYYANSHESFSYEFSLKDGQEKLALSKIGDIRYVKNRPRITPSEVARHMIQSSHRDRRFVSGPLYQSEEESERIINATILTKSNVWRHEDEWRFLRGIGEKPNYYSIEPYRFSGIVFGLRCSDELIEFVTSRLQKGIKITRLQMSSNDYELKET